MITQEITKHKSLEPDYSSVQSGGAYAQWQGGTYHRGNDLPSPTMSKLEYALFIRNMGINVGDFVVNKVSTRPFSVYQVFRVVGIDEIHRFVKYDNEVIGPLCLHLQSRYMTSPPFKGGGRQYTVVKPDDMPADWEMP